MPTATDPDLRLLREGDDEEGGMPPVVILKQVHFDNTHRPLFLSFDYLNMDIFSLQVTRQR
ncbi:hypothetical protein [Alicyclobacillus acidiphilus]|uniref:hypothetical protein n=1 Tax=Alicyclobacillus acidiphilus TaxID=182455 RepID=UPI000832A19E|nr:hypothetical protein [Alicyclobacillus acidiphilus]